MAERQIILDKNDTRLGWIPDKQIVSASHPVGDSTYPLSVYIYQQLGPGKYYILSFEGNPLSYSGAWTPLQRESMQGVYVVIEHIPATPTKFTGYLPYAKTMVYWRKYEQLPWWNVQFDGDIDSYNVEVMTALIISTLNVGWGQVTSAWWEELIAQYELSTETQEAIEQNIEKYVQEANIILENQSPSLFGFDPGEIGEFLGIGRRTGLAVIRLALGNPIMADYPYLEVIRNTPGQSYNISSGLKHLMEHPKGSHYSGDFNVEDIVGSMDPAIIFGMAVSSILTAGASNLSFMSALASSSIVTQGQMLILAGAFGAGLTAASLIQDIIDGDFGLTSVAKLGGLFLYGWGTAVQFSLLPITQSLSANVQAGVAASVTGVSTGQALASGDVSLLGKLSSMLSAMPAFANVFALESWDMFTKFQRMLFAQIGSLMGYLGKGVGYLGQIFDTPQGPQYLPRPSTVLNPGGSVTANPLQIQNPSYVPGGVAQPILVEESGVSSMMAPVAIVAGLYMVLKG